MKIGGFVALGYVGLVAAREWGGAYSADLSSEKARVAVSEAAKAAGQARLRLQKNSELLIATASVESSPARVLKDLTEVLPKGVSLAGLRMDYTAEATARLDFTVVARNPDAYDRFLAALSQSPLFHEIKPGSESRPGFVRATVTVTHRPRGAGR